MNLVGIYGWQPGNYLFSRTLVTQLNALFQVTSYA